MAVGVAGGTAYGAASCACFAFVLLVFACASPWTLWGGYLYTSPGGVITQVSYGAGPFVAGYSTSYQTNSFWVSASSVLWSELTTANACNPSSDIYTYWSQPNGLCPGGKFAIPSQAVGIQATIVLATLFSFFACSLGFSTSASRSGGGYGAAVSSLCAMVFAVCAFAIWTTWPLSMALQTAPGSYVPVWTTSGNLAVSAKTTLGYGSSYVLTVVAFAFLVFSTVGFFAVSHRLGDEADGAFGAGI